MSKVLAKMHKMSKVLTEVHKILTKVHKVLTKVHKVLTTIYKKKWLKQQKFINRFSCLKFGQQIKLDVLKMGK